MDVPACVYAAHCLVSTFAASSVHTTAVSSVAAAELIMNHWTERVEPPQDNSKPSAPDASVNAQLEPVEPEYRLRPWYQRVPFAVGQYVVGGLICYVLLSSRARIVRRLYVLPAKDVDLSAPLAPKLQKPPHDRFLVVQNAYHWAGQGEVFPFSAAKLEPAKDESELAMRVDGKIGTYSVMLPDAKINEEKLSSLWDIKQKLFTAWYGEKKGKQELAKLGWETSSEIP